MSAIVSIDDLGHEDIRAWLKRALEGKELLPKLAPDEYPYLGVLRVDKTSKPAARDSLRRACVQLVREFCEDGGGEVAYVKELLALMAAFQDPEAVELLARLASRFPEVQGIAREVRFAVLAALVDTPPPREMAFWDKVLSQNPEEYAGLALSGVLATNPEHGVAMLRCFPDDERLGEAAAIKLDLAWDDLQPRQRFQFVQDVQAVLPKCGRRFAAPVQAWADSKRAARTAGANASLGAGIAKILGPESHARARSPRLCRPEALPVG